MSQLPQKLVPLFESLKIPSSAYSSLSFSPKTKNIKSNKGQEKSAYFAFRPLLINPTSSSLNQQQQQPFIFERYQYVALGDAVINRAISKQVTKYLLRRRGNEQQEGIQFVSPTTAKQLTACFHNALSIRFVAEALPLAVEATTTTSTTSSEKLKQKEEAEEEKLSKNTNNISLVEIFSKAKTPHSGPSSFDKKGTAFDWSPLPFAQSDLGPRLSHFFGCLDLFCGSEIALNAATRAFFELDGERGNLSYEAAQVVALLCKKYSVVNVAKALMIAQGQNVNFLSRSIAAPRQEVVATDYYASSSSSSSDNNNNDNDNVRDESDVKEEEDPLSSLNENDNGNYVNSTQVATTQKNQDNNKISNVSSASSSAFDKNKKEKKNISPSSHSLGPGKLDLVSKWKKSVLKNDDVVSSDSNQKESEEGEEYFNFFGGSGWKKKGVEETTIKNSLATSTTLNYSSSSKSDEATGGFLQEKTFADVSGIPDIFSINNNESGGLSDAGAQYVMKREHSEPVKDSTFYDKDAGKDGVPFSPQETAGIVVAAGSSSNQLSKNNPTETSAATTTTKNVVDTLIQPHHRFFEVSLVRDAFISSSIFRQENYLSDVPQDLGRGRTIGELTKEELLLSMNNNSSSSYFNQSKVGPKVLSKGMGASYGEARRAAATNYLEKVVVDLSKI